MATLEDQVAALHSTVDQLSANQRSLVELAKRAMAREKEANAVADKILDLMEDHSKALSGLTLTVATLALKFIDHTKADDEDEGKRGD